MKRWASLFIFGALALPLFAAAQSVQLLTIGSPTQPTNGTALPNTTVAAVAIVLTAGNAPVSVTSIGIERVGSASDSSIVGLDVRDSATNVIASVGGSATPFNSSHTVSIPLSVSLAAGEKKTLLVSAKTATDLVEYQGQFFELNIASVGTGAVLSGALPIFGAQYTLSTGVNKPTCTLTASPGSYSIGQTVTLVWNSANATGGTITGLGSVSPKGSQGILPTGSSANYVGTFTGPGGTGTCNATVVRSNTGGVSGSGTGGGGAGGSVSTPGGPVPITPDPRTNLGTGGTNGVGDVCTGLNCQPCHFVALGQQIINWVLGFSIPLAAAMFAWAGIMYFTSATNPGNIAKARTAFMRVLVGIIGIVSAWLILQTVLYIFMTPEQYVSWNKLDCVSSSLRPTNEKVDKLFNSLPVAPTGITITGTTVNPTPDTSSINTSLCPGAGFYYDTEAANCYNPDTGASKEPVSNTSIVDSYNAQAGADQVTFKSGVNYANTDPTLWQSITSSVDSANAGAVNVTSCDDGTHSATSLHYVGGACDITYRNDAFNTYIASNYEVQSVNYVSPGQPAYKDPATGMIWSYEAPGSNSNTTGAHWHVSTTGH